MRAKSQNVIDRQAQKSADLSAKIAERKAQLSALAPNADPQDIKYVAIHGGQLDAILRILASLSAATPAPAKYTPDGVTYGSLEDTGHAYATCDVCEYVAESLRESGDCPACVAKWEASDVA